MNDSEKTSLCVMLLGLWIGILSIFVGGWDILMPSSLPIILLVASLVIFFIGAFSFIES